MIKNIKKIIRNKFIRPLDSSELQYINLVSKFVLSDSLVLDIGANIGHWSYNLISLDKNIVVFAFEPVRESFQFLVKRLYSNKNLFAYNIALSNQKKYSTILLNIDSVFPPDAAIQDTANHLKEKKNRIEVPILTDKLDNYKSLISSMNIGLSFVKIDVEGHELEVIQGGIETIDSFKPTIFIEILREKWLGKHPGNSEVSTLLQNMGYIVGQVQSNVIEFQPSKFVNSFENFLFISKQ